MNTHGVELIPISEIEVPKGRHKPSKERIESLARSMEEVGLAKKLRTQCPGLSVMGVSKKVPSRN